MIPGALEVHVQLSLRAREHARIAAAASRGACSREHGLDYSLAWTGWGKPYLTPRGKLVDVACDAIREVTGVTPEVSRTGGTSDGRFIADICRELVELGPVGASIHKLNERIRIADLAPLARIYRRILERLLVPGARRLDDRGARSRDAARLAALRRHALRRGEARVRSRHRQRLRRSGLPAAATRCPATRSPRAVSRRAPYAARACAHRAAPGATHRPACARCLSHARGVARQLPLLRRRARS